MSNVIQVQFKKPEPQSKLNGKLGLTVEQLAESLGIEPKHVREKVKNKEFQEGLKENGFNLVEFPTEFEHGNGAKQLGVDYIFDVNAAKMFVASYRSKIGRQYFGYLIKVESDAVQAGHGFGHMDPSKISEWFGDPSKRHLMAQAWLKAEEQLKETTLKLVKAETEIKENKDDPVSFVEENALPAWKVYENFPYIRHGVDLYMKTHTWEAREYFKEGCTSIFLKAFRVSKVLRPGKENYSVYSRIEIQQVEDTLKAQKNR